MNTNDEYMGCRGGQGRSERDVTGSAKALVVVAVLVAAGLLAVWLCGGWQ